MDARSLRNCRALGVVMDFSTQQRELMRVHSAELQEYRVDLAGLRQDVNFLVDDNVRLTRERDEARLALAQVRVIAAHIIETRNMDADMLQLGWTLHHSSNMHLCRPVFAVGDLRALLRQVSYESICVAFRDPVVLGPWQVGGETFDTHAEARIYLVAHVAALVLSGVWLSSTHREFKNRVVWMFIMYLRASPLLRQYALEFMVWYGCTTPVAGSMCPYALRRRAERRRSIAGRHGMAAPTDLLVMPSFTDFDNMDVMAAFVISSTLSTCQFAHVRVIVKSMVVISGVVGDAFTTVVKMVMSRNRLWSEWDHLQ